MAEARPPAEREGGMTVQEAGRLGGRKVRDERGSEFYQEIGRKGGEARKQQGVDYHELGRMGGQKVKEERGAEFFSDIGRKGGEARHGTGRGRRSPRTSGRTGNQGQNADQR